MKAPSGAVLLALFAWSAPLAAGPDSEVASAFDPDDPFDVHVSVDYRFTSRHGALKRELAGLPGADPDGPLPIVKDLVFSGTRHELVPRLELGVFTDLALAVELPVVLRDSRRLDFDQRAGDCVFPDDPGQANCIDATNSTTVVDGLLPDTGFDAEDPGSGGVGGDEAAIFRGPNRSGLDQLHLGLVWAPMNQARDASKPIWKLGAELRLSVGKIMKFDRADPGSETGISRGVHELRLYTSMARRIGWAEPFFEVWWIAPIATRGGAPLDSIDREFGANQTSAQQRAGGRFGLEAIVWDNPAANQRIGVELGGEIETLFEGRAYTDMWEVFAFAGDASSEGPLALDADPVTDGQQALSHPGVSNVEDYMTVAGRLAVDTHLADWIRLDLGLRLAWEQSHLISFADAGQDSSDDPNTVVDPGTAEVNPLHAPVVDATGHRYRLDEALSYVVSAGFRVLF